jgi:uncharacterized protein YciU (UPF0263 family)
MTNLELEIAIMWREDMDIEITKKNYAGFCIGCGLEDDNDEHGDHSYDRNGFSHDDYVEHY